MVKKVGIFLIVCSLVVSGLRAETVTQPKGALCKEIALEILEESPKVLLYQGKVYPVYQLYETTYVTLETLEAMGATLTLGEKETFICLEKGAEAHPLPPLSFAPEIASFSQRTIYIGNVKTYSLTWQGHTLVPVVALKALWEIKEAGGIYHVGPRYTSWESLYELRESGFKSLVDYPLYVELQELYWDGKVFVKKQIPPFIVEAHQTYTGEPFRKIGDGHLVHYYVRRLNGVDIESEQSYYGQDNEKFFKTCCYLSRRRYLEELFKPYHVKGTLKYNIGSFKEGESVVIWRTEKRQYYVVLDQQSKKYVLPWDSLRIEGDVGTYGGKPTDLEIEDYVTIKAIESETPYLIWTDLRRQRTYILKKEKGNWKLQKRFICSSGKNNSPTPGGLFKVEYSIPYLGMDKGYQCKNAMVFFRDYMYHSILFDREGKYVIRGLYELGYRASHGCIRLSEADSAWIYKYVPLGTTVWIH